MKLRNLNGAIRKVEGPVMINLVIGDGTLAIGLVKSMLIDSLKALYGEDTTVETSLTIQGNMLCHEDGSPFGGGAVREAVTRIAQERQAGDEDDLDLLGDGFDAVKDVVYGDDAEDELDLLA